MHIKNLFKSAHDTKSLKFWINMLLWFGFGLVQIAIDFINGKTSITEFWVTYDFGMFWYLVVSALAIFGLFSFSYFQTKKNNEKRRQVRNVYLALGEIASLFMNVGGFCLLTAFVTGILVYRGHNEYTLIALKFTLAAVSCYAVAWWIYPIQDDPVQNPTEDKQYYTTD